MAETTREPGAPVHLEGDNLSPHLPPQFAQRAGVVLKTEGIVGLGRRVARRLSRKPLHLRAWVLALRLDRPIPVPPVSVDLDVAEVTAADEETIEALAQIEEWKTGRTDLIKFLARGDRCYVARHEGQIITSQWFLDGEFDSFFLGRRIQLADNEIFAYNAFTTPALRGKGVLPHLLAKSVNAIVVSNPHKTHFLAMINVANRASLRVATKMGATRVGLIGFIEVFGVRLHYILGREALPATRRRFFFERV